MPWSFHTIIVNIQITIITLEGTAENKGKSFANRLLASANQNKSKPMQAPVLPAQSSGNVWMQLQPSAFWIGLNHCSSEVFSNKTIFKLNKLYDFSLAWESWDLLPWHNKLQSNNCNIFSPSPLCKFICFDSDAIAMQDIACLVLWSVLGTEGGNAIIFTAFFHLSLNRHPSRSDAMSRHGFCQMFHTSKIPKYSNVAREKRVNGDIFGKKWEWRMFYSSILIKLSVFCAIIYSNMYKVIPSIFWKLLPEFGNFLKRGNVCR